MNMAISDGSIIYGSKTKQVHINKCTIINNFNYLNGGIIKLLDFNYFQITDNLIYGNTVSNATDEEGTINGNSYDNSTIHIT